MPQAQLAHAEEALAELDATGVAQVPLAVEAAPPLRRIEGATAHTGHPFQPPPAKLVWGARLSSPVACCLLINDQEFSGKIAVPSLTR
uniref:Uncharacterized protein n=1 Tax=Tetraselmis sp. GSL018 TaxID=582737 RepID=A0A061S6E0_9CHLO